MSKFASWGKSDGANQMGKMGVEGNPMVVLVLSYQFPCIEICNSVG